MDLFKFEKVRTIYEKLLNGELDNGQILITYEKQIKTIKKFFNELVELHKNLIVHDIYNESDTIVSVNLIGGVYDQE